MYVRKQIMCSFGKLHVYTNLTGYTAPMTELHLAAFGILNKALRFDAVGKFCGSTNFHSLYCSHY